MKTRLAIAHMRANAKRFTDAQPSAFGNLSVPNFRSILDERRLMREEAEDRADIDRAAHECYYAEMHEDYVPLVDRQEEAPASFEERAEFERDNFADMQWKDERGGEL